MRGFVFSNKELEDKVTEREKEIEKINKIQKKLENVIKCDGVFMIISMSIGCIIIFAQLLFELKNITYDIVKLNTINASMIGLLIIFSVLSLLLVILSIRNKSNIDRKKKLLKSLIIHEVINDEILSTTDLVRPNSYMSKQIAYNLLKTLDFTEDEKGNIDVDISFTNGYVFPNIQVKEKEDWLTEDIVEAITDFSVSNIRIKENWEELEISFIISNNKAEKVGKITQTTKEEDLCNYLELKELNLEEELEELEQKK